MFDIDAHRAAVGRALNALELGWDAWPEVVVDPRLASADRLSAVLVLLATGGGDESDTGALLAMRAVAGVEDGTLDWLGRARSPWRQLARASLPWDVATATAAVQIVTTSPVYDERRIALALRAARTVCDQGHASADLVDALQACVKHLDHESSERDDAASLRHLAQRVLTSATPADVLDLSLLMDGDRWAGSAREAASALPADEIRPLVRLLGDLGPRKPSKTWLTAVGAALQPPGARWLLREWLERAATTEAVPEWPGSQIGACRGILFAGTNADVVRAAVWATSQLPEEALPPQVLGTLTRRSAAHNGAPRFPEALALKVASAAVDTLSTRASAADRQVLLELHTHLKRRDLLKKVTAALD